MKKGYIRLTQTNPNLKNRLKSYVFHNTTISQNIP